MVNNSITMVDNFISTVNNFINLVYITINMVKNFINPVKIFDSAVDISIDIDEQYLYLYRYFQQKCCDIFHIFRGGTPSGRGQVFQRDLPPVGLRDNRVLTGSKVSNSCQSLKGTKGSKACRVKGLIRLKDMHGPKISKFQGSLLFLTSSGLQKYALLLCLYLCVKCAV